MNRVLAPLWIVIGFLLSSNSYAIGGSGDCPLPTDQCDCIAAKCPDQVPPNPQCAMQAGIDCGVSKLGMKRMMDEMGVYPPDMERFPRIGRGPGPHPGMGPGPHPGMGPGPHPGMGPGPHAGVSDGCSTIDEVAEVAGLGYRNPPTDEETACCVMEHIADNACLDRPAGEDRDACINQAGLDCGLHPNDLIDMSHY